MPVHTQQDDPIGGRYGTWAAGADYKVSFHDGMVFVPYLGSAAPRNLPLRWTTASVSVGGQRVVDVEQAPTHARAPYRYEYRYGAAFVEAYDVRSDGVEQTFTLDAAPDVAGDLEIRGRIETELCAQLVRDHHGPVAFCDGKGRELIRYGAAYVLDDAGRVLDIAVSWDGDEMALVVPGGWLRDATYPVTVDPLLSPQCIDNVRGLRAGRAGHQSRHHTGPVRWPAGDRLHAGRVVERQ